MHQFQLLAMKLLAIMVGCNDYFPLNFDETEMFNVLSSLFVNLSSIFVNENPYLGYIQVIFHFLLFFFFISQIRRFILEHVLRDA